MTERAYKLVKNGVTWDYSDLVEDCENWRDTILRCESSADVQIVVVTRQEMMDWKQS